MFDKYFEVFLADTAESRKINFQIRYQVYCDEMGFEDKSVFIHKEEWDKWDHHSVHFIVRHKYTGQWVGAMRLVSPDNSQLPLSKHTTLIDNQNNAIQIKSSNVELSRLCLIKEIRRRSTDSTPPLGLNKFQKTRDEQNSEKVEAIYKDRRINLSIIWGLFRAAADYSAQNNIKRWFFLTNKALARVIGREGFLLHPAGEGCEHAGKRYPFTMELDEIFAREPQSDMAAKVKTSSYQLFSEYQYNEKNHINSLSRYA